MIPATRLGFGVIDQFCRADAALRFVAAETDTGPKVPSMTLQPGLRSTSPGNRETNAVLQTSIQQEELSLLLVRVHLEYLADLGGGVRFACVDLGGLMVLSRCGLPHEGPAERDGRDRDQRS